MVCLGSTRLSDPRPGDEVFDFLFLFCILYLIFLSLFVFGIQDIIIYKHKASGYTFENLKILHVDISLTLLFMIGENRY